ncbi:MAG: hypothetical protein Q7I93_01955 [Syntrophales bacterium]|nr:hypothetical protein [Syntrophales bacterium]
MTYKTIITDKQRGYAIITMNRPREMNALFTGHARRTERQEHMTEFLEELKKRKKDKTK